MTHSHHSTGIPKIVDPSSRIAIVYATYYKEEIGAMVKSAQAALIKAGIPKKNIALYKAPGSFEIPLLGAALAESKKADALIGLGIIVQGETHHADLLADSVVHGMMEIQVKYRIPFSFEVLYVESIAQARARGEKGKEAANAVLCSLAELKRIEEHHFPSPEGGD